MLVNKSETIKSIQLVDFKETYNTQVIIVAEFNISIS